MNVTHTSYPIMQKTKKENSMLEKFVQRFELELERVRTGISKNNDIKNIE